MAKNTDAEQLAELLWSREQFEAAVAATEAPAALGSLRSILLDVAACIDRLQEPEFNLSSPVPDVPSDSEVAATRGCVARASSAESETECNHQPQHLLNEEPNPA